MSVVRDPCPVSSILKDPDVRWGWWSPCRKDCEERCRLWPHPVLHYRCLDSDCHVTAGRESHVRTGVPQRASGGIWHQRSKSANRTAPMQIFVLCHSLHMCGRCSAHKTRSCSLFALYFIISGLGKKGTFVSLFN
jgi:hypothetical protein